jgi:hypothetical protein
VSVLFVIYQLEPIGNGEEILNLGTMFLVEHTHCHEDNLMLLVIIRSHKFEFEIIPESYRVFNCYGELRRGFLVLRVDQFSQKVSSNLIPWFQTFIVYFELIEVPLNINLATEYPLVRTYFVAR